MRFRWAPYFIVLAVFLSFSQTLAQDKLAAVLEVIDGVVEVRRVDTANWLAVRVEAIVGVGDVIRTDRTGKARITFFANGTDVTLEPNTIYGIRNFEGSETNYTLDTEVLAGQTLQRIARLAGATPTYQIDTPAMTLAARGTVFVVRVLEDGRSAMLVREGGVDADNPDSEVATVNPGFGIRGDVGQPVSDVVRATTFDQLDSAIDGCAATTIVPGDVSVNVRVGPGVTFERVGVIDAVDIRRIFGRTENSGWYRIAFRGAFAWVQLPTVDIRPGCAGVRVFPDDAPAEDASLYTESSPAPEATPTG